jgi:RNA polymerase sigma factor (sigma-70 family)
MEDARTEEKRVIMSGDTTLDVGQLIEQLSQGDDAARRALLERIHHRLRRIAARMMRGFPQVRAQHDVDSVVDDAWMQLMKALETVRPETPDRFYRLVFRKVRHVLLDMARRQAREDALRKSGVNPLSTGSGAELDVSDTTMEPSRLAFWTEIHREVGRLPEDQRTVFRFHYFAEFPQAEIARLMNLHPRQVSRLWVAATMRLAQRLSGLEELNS